MFIGWTNKFCSSVVFRSVMSFTGKDKASSQGEYFEQDDRIRMSVLFYFQCRPKAKAYGSRNALSEGEYSSETVG